jgi:hypothetical protein
MHSHMSSQVGDLLDLTVSEFETLEAPFDFKDWAAGFAVGVAIGIAVVT